MVRLLAAQVVAQVVALDGQAAAGKTDKGGMAGSQKH